MVGGDASAGSSIRLHAGQATAPRAPCSWAATPNRQTATGESSNRDSGRSISCPMIGPDHCILWSEERARGAALSFERSAASPLGAVQTMHVEDESQALALRPPWLNEIQHPPAAEGITAGNGDRLASLELESLLLNLEGALKVQVRHQLFNWTQGALQNLITHDLLVCALCRDRTALQHIDSFSTAPVEPSHFNELFRQDASLVPALFKAWEDNLCQPVVLEVGNGDQHCAGALARELAQRGASSIVAHGTHDAAGQVTSLFTFATRPGAIGPRQLYLAEVVVPFLHTAWMRTQVNWHSKNPGAKQT